MMAEISGYIASALVLVTFATTDMRTLRTVAVLSNIAFIFYGAINAIYPVLVLHMLLLPLNLVHLRACIAFAKRQAFSAEQRDALERVQSAIEKKPTRPTDRRLSTPHRGERTRTIGSIEIAATRPHYCLEK